MIVWGEVGVVKKIYVGLDERMCEIELMGLGYWLDEDIVGKGW